MTVACPVCEGVNPSQFGYSWRTLCDSHLDHFIRYGHVEPPRKATS
jgi:hypothetical protein